MFEKIRSDMNPHQAYRIKKLQRQLDMAESYEEWKSFALKLDEETGAQEWKFDNSSPYFDAELISYRYTLLKRYRQQHRTLDLIYLLKEGLTYDIANIGHPMLFAATHVGTKKLIEDYIEEVSQSLAYIASSECITFQRKEKIEFLKTVKKHMDNLLLCFRGEQP